MKCPTPEDRQHAFTQAHSWSVRALLPRLDWHALWKDEEEEDWLLYPLIPARRLIALFSAAKTGKSLLMLEIAAALSTGKKVLGHDPGRRIKILYIDFENDPRGDVRTRLQDMGYTPGELDSLDYLSFPSLPYLDSEAGAAALLAAVDAYGPELVVIDTISRAVGGDENDNDTWLNLYKHTGLALKQAQVAMIRLDHTGKDETKGQRGGSAKAGDVDAIWKLTTVTRDERYHLTCIDARFSLGDKELTLVRHDEPLLHHTVEGTSSLDDREARIVQLVEKADLEGLPKDTSGAQLIKWAQIWGLKFKKNGVHEEAARRRKPSPRLVFEPSPPGGGGGVSPTVNGNGHKPLSDPPPVTGGRSGVAPSPIPPPLSLSIREGAGEGVKVPEPKPGDEPCSICGEPLGWSMVRRNLTVHVPGCSEVMK